MIKLYIWGIGKYASLFLDTNKYLAPLIEGVICTSKEEIGEMFFGIPVYNPDDMIWDANTYVVIVSRKELQDATVYLEKRGYEYLNDFCDYSFSFRKWRTAPKNGVHVNRYIAFMKEQKRCSYWIPEIEEKIFRNSKPYRDYILQGGGSALKAVLECCISDDYHIELAGAVIEIGTVNDLVVLVNDILLNEEYYFETDLDSPVIIDGGSNIGMSIYYFKHLYPNSSIMGFEPNPEMIDILQRNIKINEWKNITLFPYALGNQNTERKFYIQKCSLSGSMYKRNLEGIKHERIGTINVIVRRLRDYLPPQVDMLKLDIEGSETEVIEDIEDLLAHVNNIFVEFHEGKLKGNNSIARILNILEQKKFDINVSKSNGSLQTSKYRPMKSVGTRISELIWGKQKCENVKGEISE